jgi:hypothetical protein
MRTFLPSSTPAVLIATGALLLAATGGAVAGGMVTGAQIKDGTVTSADVKNKTLKVNDLSPAAVSSLQSGATGPAGPAGTNGTNGTNGVSGIEHLTASSAIAAAGQGFASKECPAGKQLVGATADWTGSYLPTSVYSNGSGATAYGKNTNGLADTLRLQIHCITAS